MTVNLTADSVLRMLGYINNLGYTNDSDLRSRIIPQINNIYADLYYMSGLSSGKDGKPFEAAAKPDDEIKLPQHLLDNCFLYGVAMSVAAAEGDGEQQQYFAALYNQKRRMCTHFDEIIDVFPSPWL